MSNYHQTEAVRSEARAGEVPVVAEEAAHPAPAAPGFGIWLLRFDADFISWSDEACRILGIDSGHADLAAYLTAVYPQDRQLVAAALELAWHSHIAPDLEHRILQRGSILRVVRLRGQLLREGGHALLAGTVHDVTDTARDAGAQRASAEGLMVALNSMTDGFGTLDRAWRISYINLEAERLLRRARDELIGHVLWHEFPDLLGTRFETELRRAVADERPVSFDAFYPPTSSWKELHVFPSPEGLAVYFTDITERKQAELVRAEGEAYVRRQAALLDKAQDAITVIGLDGTILYWNQGAERLLGWSAAEALGRVKSELLHIPPAAYQAAHRSALERGDWSGALTKLDKQGRPITCECHFTLVRDDDGKPQSVLEIETDITDRIEATRRIEDLAFFDPLTKLPNRRLLLDRLQHALGAAGRNQCTGALLFIDLDNFKDVNDTLGHDIGDLLLQQVARRLEACVLRQADTVARLSGDEFVLMLEDLGSDAKAAAANAEILGEKVLAAFSEVFQLNAHQRHATPSIGVALFDGRSGDVDTLLKRADLAMYQSKKAGRNTVRFFDPGMQTVVTARVELETELRAGLLAHEFVLHYQRQTDNHGRTIGAEALLRWRHPQRGLLAPAVFLALAEETGLILRLGQWVLEAACGQLARWAGRPETAAMSLAVNISARQFRQDDFVDQVLAALAASGADPRRLRLELTESLLTANTDSVAAKMTALRARGVAFALDDFGTGCSSLAYLIGLPLDQLKIDRSFVGAVLSDPHVGAVASTIVTLGRTLGLDVIAEGVETAGQRDFLEAHGCHAYQGYLFSRPLPAEQF